MTQYTVENMMKAYAEDAEDLGKQLGKILDYSEESIKIVEEILEIYHKSLPKGFLSKLLRIAPTEDKIAQMAKIWGGYIGEVIRKHIGGDWSLEDNIITLTIGETKIFPPAKVYKRLMNGSEDNVLFYYQMVKQDF